MNRLPSRRRSFGAFGASGKCLKASLARRRASGRRKITESFLRSAPLRRTFCASASVIRTIALEGLPGRNYRRASVLPAPFSFSGTADRGRKPTARSRLFADAAGGAARDGLERSLGEKCSTEERFFRPHVILSRRFVTLEDFVTPRGGFCHGRSCRVGSIDEPPAAGVARRRSANRFVQKARRAVLAGRG